MAGRLRGLLPRFVNDCASSGFRRTTTSQSNFLDCIDGAASDLVSAQKSRTIAVGSLDWLNGDTRREGGRTADVSTAQTAGVQAVVIWGRDGKGRRAEGLQTIIPSPPRSRDRRAASFESSCQDAWPTPCPCSGVCS